MLGVGMSLASIRHTKKCDRCGLRYPDEAAECTHCTGLSDDEVDQIKERAEEQAAAHRRLGLIMWGIALLVAVALLLSSFS